MGEEDHRFCRKRHAKLGATLPPQLLVIRLLIIIKLIRMVRHLLNKNMCDHDMKPLLFNELVYLEHELV